MGFGSRFVRFGLLFSREDNGECNDDCQHNCSDYHNSNKDSSFVISKR